MEPQLLSAEDYFRAALERARDGVAVYERSRHVLAIYTAGVAVECMLRAFWHLHDPTFDARHDLRALLKWSKLLFYSEQPETSAEAAARRATQTREVQAAVNQLAAVWNNSLRYMDERKLVALLKKTRLFRAEKDILKAAAKQVLEAAQLVVNRGYELWTYAKRRSKR
jgi:hypothetical protein